jgi:hypothetical protein
MTGPTIFNVGPLKLEDPDRYDDPISSSVAGMHALCGKEDWARFRYRLEW